MDIRYCPSCGAARQLGGMFCASCGNRLGIDVAPTSPFADDFSRRTPDAQWPSPVVSSTSNESLLKVLRILVALSPLPALLVVGEDWWWVKNIELIWIFSVLPLSLIVAIPILGNRRLFGIQASDSRFIFMSAFAALFVACRSAGTLLDEGWFAEQGLSLFSQLIGLAGFVIFGISFPWNKPIRSWFVQKFNFVHILVAAFTALAFVMFRNDDSIYFIFSPASISGHNFFEYVLVVVVASLGFLVAPWRHCLAILIGFFSLISHISNLMFYEDSVKGWPNHNLVMFIGCIALCFPWEEMADSSRKSF